MELFSLDFGLIFWMFVTVFLLIVLLGKFAWPFIVKSLEERANLIDNGVLYAQEAKAQLETAQQEAAKYITEAQKQQAEILREAAKMKTQIIEEAKEAAAGAGTTEEGTAKPMPSYSVDAIFIELIPITLPSPFTRAPPELPGLIADVC